MEDDMTIIKSLIAISRGGLLLDNIGREFREMNGSPLNFRKYGFNSIPEMLKSSKDIVLKQSPRGILCHVNDEKISHVTSLVNRTAVKPKRKRPSKPRAYFNPPRAYSPQPRYGMRRGSVGEPSRRPFRPVNRMQYDENRRTTSTRPQAVSRFPNTSVTTSPMKQYNQNPCGNYRYRSNGSSAYNFERGQKNEPKPVQSSSIGSTVSKPLKPTATDESDWSSDSEQPHTAASSLGLTSKSVLRPQAEVQLLKSNLSTQETVAKAQAVRKPMTKGSSKSSGSDWSSLDSGSASSLTDVSKKTMAPPRIKCSTIVQNGAVSSSSKPRRLLKTTSDSNSDWSDSSEHLEDKPSQSSSGCSKPSFSGMQCTEPSSLALVHTSPPLMVGGVGRGKARSEVNEVKPGMNQAKTHRLHSPSRDIIVTGSPCKRETSTTLKNGLPTILVKVRNEPAISVPKLQEATIIAHQKSTVASCQFVGDFLLHRVATVTLGLKFPENGGLCRSRLSILDCIKEIGRDRSSRPIILMIGMTDILEGATFEEMVELTTMLLQRLSTRRILLLTLPVLPLFIKIGFERKLTVLEKYNKWLLDLPLPAVIETERHLYCDAPFYTRFSRSEVETFSDAGCWVVIDEIIGAATQELLCM